MLGDGQQRPILQAGGLSSIEVAFDYLLQRQACTRVWHHGGLAAHIS